MSDKRLPFRDEEFPEPAEMQAFRAKMTYRYRLEQFRQIFRRDPQNDDELDLFIDELVRELYNSGDL